MNFLSVCSGIEAASVAWHPLGWRAHAFAEVEPFPSQVLAHHYPNTPNWGDMTRFREWPDAAIDVLVGGTPCQSFSVAGLRKGLADPRGNLMLVYLGILDRYRPRWMVWENVPGVLSSNKGRDFGAFLGGLAKLGYGFAYAVLDAQYFGLAQRRKRVFVVGYLGDWRRAAAVLFEPGCLQGHPAPRREAGQSAAPTLSARTKGGGGLGTDFDRDGGLVAASGLDVPGLRRGELGNERIADLDDAMRVVRPLAFGGNNTSGPIDVATAQTAQTAHGGSGRYDFESETFIAHALRGEGFDASEDGTGRGTPLVPICFDETQITSSQNRSNPQLGDPSHPLAKGARPPTICFSAKDHGADAINDLAPTLRAGGHSNSHANAGVMPAIAHGWMVRRLTPRECERLQGFPDDYTLIPLRNKRGQHNGRWAKDGPRYKALGNSMAVPVMRWIGEGIEAVDELKTIKGAA